MDEREYDPKEEMRCPRCGVLKMRRDFFRQSASSDGVSAYCKGCMKEYQRARRVEIKTRLTRGEEAEETILRLRERVAQLKRQLGESQLARREFAAGMELVLGQEGAEHGD